MSRNPPSYDLAVILSENGFGVLGKNIFIGRSAPNKPDAVISIAVYGTYEQASSNMSYKSPKIQILVRDSVDKNKECSDKIYIIDSFVHGLEQVVVGDSRYAFFLNTNEPIEINNDINKRPIWVSNYRCLLGRSTNGR